MSRFFFAMTRHPLSLTGAALTTACAALFIILYGVEMLGHAGGPYLGILTFMILPAGFLLGLVLIPVGIIRHRRRAAAAEARGEDVSLFPVVDLNREKVRRGILIFVALTVVNLAILAIATFKGVEYMESTEFCGQVCHSVMDPEYTTYSRSPHSRVDCVDCHIGPGADWFVKSKLSGAWQVVSTAFDLYPRPIPTPVHNLRPARDTCEQCHWPTKFHGNRVEVYTHFGEDEANTETKTVLVLRVGGLAGNESEGIHWHVDPGIQIRYRSDEAREEIYEVELTRSDGSVATYYPAGKPDNGALHGEWRVMDCVDCHNRPTHIYRLPSPEIDEAIHTGRISRELPFIKREGRVALEAEYASHEEARAEIPARIQGFYEENHPEILETNRDAVVEAGRVLAGIYAINVHPKMNITWGTYPNHIGHEQAPGCFRCHNDDHATAEGGVISQDCDTCHALLALEEEDPEVLQQFQ